MKAKGDDRKAFAVRALRWLCNCNPELDPNAVLRRDPGDLPALSEERAVQALVLRLAAPAGAKADDKDASPDGAEAPPPASDWRALARTLSESAAALDHPDATAAERILAMAQQLAAACRTAAEAAAATEALARRAEALHGRLTSAAAALAPAWPAEVDGAFLDTLEASLDALETAIARAKLAQDRRQKLDEQARAAHAAGDLDAEEDLFPQRRAARTESEAAKAAVMGAMQGLETLLQGTRTPPAEEDDAGEEAPTGGMSKPSDGTAEPEVPAGSEPEPEQEINDSQPEEAAAPWSGATDPSETAPASNYGVPPSQAPQSGATTAAEEVPDPPPREGPKAPPHDGSLFDTALLHWLNAGEIALAFHAARLAEQQGARAALPPAVLRGLALLRDIRRAEDMADPARTGAMAEMMGSLAEASPHAGRVAFAALLRPALFDPDHRARAHLRSLSADEALAPYAAVTDALGALGPLALSERLARLGSWARSQPSIAEAAGLSDQDRAVLRFLVEDGAALERAEELAEFCPEADRPRLTRLIAGGWLQMADRPGSVPWPTDLGRLAAT